jgi:3-oxoacyl-[acyl-carrier protein] reductase
MKVVFITGASRGIGRAIALRFSRDVDIQFVLHASTLANLADTHRKIMSNCERSPLLLGYDMQDITSISNAFKEIHKNFGQLDVMINNAGIMKAAPIGMITSTLIDETLGVNLKAPILHLQSASKMMARNQGGTIINISSILGTVTRDYQLIYSASKAALQMATRVAARELAPKNISVNAIAPGFVPTQLHGDLSDDQLSAATDMVGMGRLGSSAEVAELAFYLSTPMARYITGQIMGIDGGMRV